MNFSFHGFSYRVVARNTTQQPKQQNDVCMWCSSVVKQNKNSRFFFSFYGFSAKVVAREHNSAAEIAKRCLQVVKFICKNKTNEKKMKFSFCCFSKKVVARNTTQQPKQQNDVCMWRSLVVKTEAKFSR